MEYQYDQSRDHFLYEYPCSGKAIQEIRALLFLKRCLPDKHPDPNLSELSGYVGHTGHFGFDALASPFRAESFPNFPPPGSKVAVILNEAVSTLVACHFYLYKYSGKYKVPVPKDNPPSPNLDEYLTSSFGVEKFVNFLNAIQDEVNTSSYDFTLLFSEDLFSRDAVASLPSIIGLPTEVSEADVDSVYQITSGPSAIKKLSSGIGRKKSPALSPNLLAYVRDAVSADTDLQGLQAEIPSPEAREHVIQYIAKNSRLSAYNERYGYKIA